MLTVCNAGILRDDFIGLRFDVDQANRSARHRRCIGRLPTGHLLCAKEISRPERAANRLTGNKSRPLMLRLRPCGWPHIGKSARSESTLRLPPCYFSPRPASRFASGAFVLSTLSCRQELPNHLSCHDILGEPFIVLGYACSRSNSRRQKTTKARIIYEGII
jgi:hypothetical protein